MKMRMRMRIKFIFICFLAPFFCFFSACNVLKPTSYNELDGELYSMKRDSTVEKIFLLVEDDVFKIHPIKEKETSTIYDSVEKRIYPRIVKEEIAPDLLEFYNNGLNVEIITLPIKIRPPIQDVPAQLNCDFNGAVFVGYRFSKYTLSYSPIADGLYTRRISDYKFSCGCFIGIGSTMMSPTTTSHASDNEYDGVILQKGVAGNFEINNLTFGIALGFDNLLSKNRQIWIYENKPYLALSLGFNIQ